MDALREEVYRLLRGVLGLKARADHGMSFHMTAAEINRLADMVGLERDFMQRHRST